MLKYDFKTNQYYEYSTPDDWYVTCRDEELDTLINCANCGKRITYGEGYTSRKIHNSIGFGYVVCQACCQTEAKEELKYRKSKK